MKDKFAAFVTSALAVSLLASALCLPAQAQATAFTYQGRLHEGVNPANGIYDLRFTIYNAADGGAAQSVPLTNSATPVSNGLFTVALDFGAGVFTGANRWLEIAVRTNGAGSFSPLSPRQPLTASPYAIFANTASNLSGTLPAGQLAGTIPSAQLGGSYSSAVTLNNNANSFSGAFTGNGGGLSNVNAATLGGLSRSNFWSTTGNAGTTPGLNFLGTTDNQPLLMKGSFVGIGRSTPVTSAEFFGIDGRGTTFGGMYVNTTNATGWPFYGYSQAGAVRAYHYVDGGDTNKWKLFVGGTRLTVTPNGEVGVGTANPSARLEVAGQIKITGGSPGAGKLLLSDSNGLASWQPPSVLSIFFGQNYSVLIPDVIDNTAYIEIEGVMQDNVVVINGPGLEIQRVIGFSGTNSNDQPGPNMEYPFVFEYAGTYSNALQTWFQNPNDPKAMSLLVKNLGGVEIGRWNLFEMKCTQIDPGTEGRKRYTLRHTLPPNNLFSYEREFTTPANPSKNPATDLYRIEIEGVDQGGYPTTQIDYTNRTITLVFDYTEAGQIYNWMEGIAEGLADKKNMSVITEVNGAEVSRRNFFGVFPISFQYSTGFGQVDKLKEKVILSFDLWQEG